MRLQSDGATRAVNSVFGEDPVPRRTQKGDMIVDDDAIVESRQIGRRFE